MGVNKATKKMARKGHLKNAIHARRKHKKTTGRRQPHKGSRAPAIEKAGDEFRKDGKKKSALDDMDAEEFLQGGFEEDFDDEDVSGDEGLDSDDLSDLEDEEAGSEDGDEDGSGEDEEDGDDEDGSDLEDGTDELSGGSEEGDESDGDEDGQAAAADPVVQDNKRLKGEISKHRAQLEALREKDPEFYEYLKEADAELLGFGVDEDDEEGDDDEGEDEEEDDDEEEGGKKKAAEKLKKKEKGKKGGDDDGDDDEGAGEEDEEEAGTSGRIEVTSALAARWCAAARGQPGPDGRPPALGSLGYLLRAYRLACHYGDGQDDADTGRLRITSSTVYNTVMLFVLREADGIFRRLLGLQLQAEGKGGSGGAAGRQEGDLLKNPRWRKVGPLVKSFWGNSIHLLGTITDPALLAFTLRRLRSSVSLLAPLARHRDRFLRACLRVFGTGEVAPRLQAFLAIRAMAVSLPQPTLDNCLKGVYRTFVSNSKFVSASSAPHIAFMATCIVDLWGLDMAAAYQHAFTAVRQLAQMLRTALTSKTADSYKTVYCWQSVNCLELWARVLGAHADRTELRPLVYPVVQLLMGAVRLVPTPRYFPLRLRLAHALNRLSEQAGVFVPVAPLVCEALGWADLRRSPGGGGSGKGGKGGAAAVAGGCPDLTLQLRLGKQLLRSAACQEEVVTQLLEILAQHLATWSCSIAFPELAHVPLLHLRKFLKGCPVERFKRSAKQLMEAVQRNVVWVGAARDRIDFGPKDSAKVQAFLRDEREAGRAPLQQYAAALARRAAQRAAARKADEVDVGDKRNAAKRGRDREEDDEEIEENGIVEEEDDEEMEDEEEEAAAAKVSKALKRARKEDEDDGAVNGFGEEDVLAEYVPSSDDYDEGDDVIEGESGDDSEEGDEEGSEESEDDGAGPLDASDEMDEEEDERRGGAEQRGGRGGRGGPGRGGMGRGGRGHRGGRGGGRFGWRGEGGGRGGRGARGARRGGGRGRGRGGRH